MSEKWLVTGLLVSGNGVQGETNISGACFLPTQFVEKHKSGVMSRGGSACIAASGSS